MTVKKATTALLAVMGMVLWAAFPAGATVELSRIARTQLNAAPRDMVVSLSGRWVFVLSDAGELLVYGGNGKLTETLKLELPYDRIHLGAEENIVFLSDSKSRVVDTIHLEFIRKILTEGSPVKGPKDAPVTVAVFSDFQCPYCGKLGPLFEQVMQKYPREVRLVYKHFPLNSHPFAFKAALASMAALAQGKFWEYHDLLYARAGKLDDEAFSAIATELGLDKEAFAARMNDQETFLKVREDYREGIEVGVQGTPAIYVNGRMVRNRTLEGISELVEKGLADSKK